MSYSEGRDLGYTLPSKHILVVFLHRCLIIDHKNFAATQIKGISHADFCKYLSKAEAEEAYRQAVEDGYIEVL